MGVLRLPSYRNEPQMKTLVAVKTVKSELTEMSALVFSNMYEKSHHYPTCYAYSVKRPIGN